MRTYEYGCCGAAYTKEEARRLALENNHSLRWLYIKDYDETGKLVLSMGYCQDTSCRCTGSVNYLIK